MKSCLRQAGSRLNEASVWELFVKYLIALAVWETEN